MIDFMSPKELVKVTRKRSMVPINTFLNTIIGPVEEVL